MAVIYGTTVSDFLVGTANADVIFGDAGNDTIFAAGGSGDYIDAGAGNDWVSLLNSVMSTARMGSGNDFVETVLGGNTIDGGTGQDRVSYNGYSTSGIVADLSTGKVATGGMFSVVDMLVSIEELLGTKYNDTLGGSANADLLHGMEGDDIVFGGAGNDKLYGGAGNDKIYAGQGDDFIYAGTGNNTIDLGGPSGEVDTVKHAAANSGIATVDHIYNFDVAGADVLRLFGTSFSSFADIQSKMFQVGSDTYIATGGVSTIVLHGVNKSTLTAADFAIS